MRPNAPSRHPYATRFCFGLLLMGTTVRPASADEADPVALALPETVVTATRDRRPALATPFSTATMNAADLRTDRAVRTVPEALESMPGTMVQKTGHAQGSPYIRGFTGYRDLLLIDGIRLNNAVFRDGPNQYWNTVDPYGLHGLELVRGPFSTLYGSDAIGGTVHALTRGVEDLRPASTWDRRLYYRYASAERSHIARAESIGRLTDALALTLGYTFKEFGDLEGGDTVGTQAKTGYDERDWDAKLEYFFSDDAVLVVAHQSVDIDDAWRTHTTIYGIDWENLTLGSELRRALDQDRDLTYVQYHRYGGNGLVEEVHAGVSHHLQAEEQDRLRTRNRLDRQGFDVHTVGAFVTLKSPTPAGDLIYGAEVYRDTIDAFNDTLNPDGTVKSSAIQGPVADDATYDRVGLYLQDEFSLGRRVTCLVGGRYEYARADADQVQDPVSGGRISLSEDWERVVGSARVLYALDTGRVWNLFAGISQGFRAPNLSDLTRFDAARTDEIETPAPELDPESFVSCETGLKHASAAGSLQLAYFYTDIEDMIIRTPTGRVIDEAFEVTKKNAGAGYVHGVELDARLRLPSHLVAFASFTWMDGEVDTYPTSEAARATEPIDRLMPPTGRAGLRWAPVGGYWLEGAGTVAGKADTLSSSDRADTSRIPPGGTPGYTVYDVRAGWRWTDALALSVAVENVADEDYRVHGSGINEPGRNVIVSADCTF